jgi:hypothetical protein
MCFRIEQDCLFDLSTLLPFLFLFSSSVPHARWSDARPAFADAFEGAIIVGLKALSSMTEDMKMSSKPFHYRELNFFLVSQEASAYGVQATTIQEKRKINTIIKKENIKIKTINLKKI